MLFSHFCFHPQTHARAHAHTHTHTPLYTLPKKISLGKFLVLLNRQIMWLSRINQPWEITLQLRAQIQGFICLTRLLLSCSVVSDSLRPHELQHAKLPCLTRQNPHTNCLSVMEAKQRFYYLSKRCRSEGGLLIRWACFHVCLRSVLFMV